MYDVKIFKPGEVENGFPIPKFSTGRPAKYKFNDLQVGQSFMVFCPLVESKRLLASLRSCRMNIQRRYGKKFGHKRMPKGIRVWRIS